MYLLLDKNIRKIHRKNIKVVHNSLKHLNNRPINLKQSRKRPGVAQRAPGGLGSQISMTFVTWRWWGYRPHAPAAFTTQEMFLVLIFTRGLSRTQGHGTVGRNMSMKNPVTPSGNDPGTVRLVAQRLYYYATSGPGVRNEQYESKQLRVTTIVWHPSSGRSPKKCTKKEMQFQYWSEIPDLTQMRYVKCEYIYIYIYIGRLRWSSG